MKTLWEPAVREELLGRFARLHPDQRPVWGQMTSAQMVAHCTDPMRAAMGEMKVEAKSGPFRKPWLRYLVIYWMPWPKGAPTAPEFIHSEPGVLEDNLSAMRATVDRFVARATSGGFEDHPAFGRVPLKDWGCLMYRHLDHHLRQFGV